jgi:hypothetical protein
MAIKINGTEIIDDSLNVTTSVGTVDGRDVSVDGTKLDTIDTNADVTATELPSALSGLDTFTGAISDDIVPVYDQSTSTWKKSSITNAALQGPKGQTGGTGDKGQKGQTGSGGSTGSKGQKGEIGGTGGTGSKGQKGEIGVTGSQGIQGIQGLQGVVGNTGSTGAKGNTGSTGLTGSTGSKGQKGELGGTGLTGGTGSKGQKGEIGNTGSGGSDGSKGQKGEVGAKGSTGSTGLTGDKGQKGVTGSQGIQGNTGSTGLTGSTGPAGASGTNGTNGSKGQKGEIGATGGGGATGSKGQKGEIGAKGSTGAVGSKGQKGQKGEVGANGSNGAAGAKGQKGEIGVTGSKGQKGEDGWDGTWGATCNAGWITVANFTSGRGYAELYIYDNDSSDHAFMHLTAMRSYNGSSINVLQQGGHARRITGARFIETSNDTTYGNKKLQVYVTVSSYYRVQSKYKSKINGFTTVTPQNPVLENTPSGYQAQGVITQMTNEYGGMATSGTLIGQSLRVGANEVINSSGVWVGSDSGLKGQKGEVGAKGNTGSTGGTGAKGSTGSTGSTGAVGAKGSTGSTGGTGAKGQKGQTGSTGSTGGGGATGQKGEKGQKGQTGSTGAQGIQGPGGSTGAKGQKGQKGQTGATGGGGATGAKGQKGQKGEIGAKGQKGEIGITGPNGGSSHYVNSGDNYSKYRFWGNASTYAMGMYAGQTHGELNDYAMTFQMNNDADRGFAWKYEGMAASQAAMSLTTGGKLNVSESVKIGYGISDTSNTSYDLQVSGNSYVTGDMYVGDQIIHIGDTDTYTQFHAANQWRVVTGGTERLEVNNDTMTVAATLSMNGHSIDMNDNNIYDVEDIGLQDRLYHEGDSDTYLEFDADRIRLTAGGWTGIDVVEGGTDYVSVGDNMVVTNGGSARLTDTPFWENRQTVTSSYTITDGYNAMSAGPITINSGVTVTVGAGETWTVI